MPIMPEDHYDRFDPTKNYERHLYRAGYVVQGAELNETQTSINDRVKRIADVLFKDGAVVKDAAINVDQTTGETVLAAGVLYVRGAMRGVAPTTRTISLTGTVAVGVYLQETVVTELEDPTLRDPATKVRNYGVAGAARLKVEAVWGTDGDGTAGDFFPVYSVVDGLVQSTEPPPAIDAIALSISAYDRDSTGGFYIVDGYRVIALPDDETGAQVYSLSAGNARVNGRQILSPHGRRVIFDAQPDLKSVLGEAKLAAGGANERVNLNHDPVAFVDLVQITVQKTVTLTHGAFTGVADLLPDSPVQQIIAVNQGGTSNGAGGYTGGTTYAQNTDFTLNADRVDWSPAGAEPAPGSTYSVTYRYLAVVTPSSPDAKGFSVSDAVPGTTILTSYRWKRPRIDRMCMAPDGTIQWVRGVPNDDVPRAPAVPAGLLSITTVEQTWDADRIVSEDGVRVQKMDQLLSLEAKVDNLFALQSEAMLKVEVALSDPTTKRGVFVDNFDNNDKRDAGKPTQSAAITDGVLTLATTNVQVKTISLGGTQTLPLNTAGTYPVIQQTLRTGTMLVNPYMAYDLIPARCTLEPATDFWTATVDVWATSISRRFTTAREVIDRTSSAGLLKRTLWTESQVLVNDATELLSTKATDAATLRSIPISFTLQGFGPSEWLDVVRFDGLAVSFTA